MKYYLSVIIPAFNEAKRLPGTLEKTIHFLNAQPYASEIIVVTDGSTDGTAEVAESFKTRYPGLTVLSFEKNKGKGFAVRAGMLRATGQLRLFMDADYAVPIEYVQTFIDSIGAGADIVIASRALKDSKLCVKQGFARRVLAQAFGKLQRLILALPFPDTQCGFKMFRAESAESLFRLLQYNCAYFDAELLYVAHHLGTKVAEIGVDWTHDQETRLPIGLVRSLDLFKKLLLIRKIHRTTVSRKALRLLEPVK